MHRSEADFRDGLARVGRWMIVAVLLCMARCSAALGAPAESLEVKLAMVTDYVPKAPAPVDQLIEVAREFNVPMAIEWVDRDGAATHDKVTPARKRSVREMIEEIVCVAPEHSVEVEGELVRVYSPAASAHPFNFLNISLESYYVNDGDLFEAADQLRWAIRFTLEPEKYRHGYGGGYGHGANDIFENPKFTLSGSDITIREVLDRIALAQGNALWVATIKETELGGRDPFWKRQGADEGDAPVTSRWRFLPLADIPELAKEQVGVDVAIEGMFDRRMTTIPVMLEEGLIANFGMGAGGSSSEGDSWDYGASVEKVDKDFVTLSVHLTVRRRDEAERKFDEKLRVTKGQVSELQPEPRIKIRAYIEPRVETSEGRAATLLFPSGPNPKVFEDGAIFRHGCIADLR